MSPNGSHDLRKLPDGWTRDDVFLRGPDKNRADIIEIFHAGDPQAPDLLFVHGWGMSPVAYAPAINAIAELGWRIHAPSLPGFGRSTPLPGARNLLPRTATVIHEALTEAAVPTSSPVVAHSYGCGVAVTIARSNPTWASHLTLICPIGGIENHLTTWPALLAGLRHEIGNDTLTRVRDALPNLLAHPVALAETGITAKHTNLVDAIRETATHTPVHIILADHDGIVPAGRLHTLTGNPGITVTTTPGTHGYLLSHPDLLPAHVPHPPRHADNRIA
jgi:pimeloyl-ACP methyl ester carboxylesterase